MVRVEQTGPAGVQRLILHADHDVRVPVEELDELLQAPQAALQAAKYEACHRILSRCGTKVRVL